MGFWAGSLALIVLYVAVQPGTASKTQAGGNALVELMKRALSPDVPAIPDRSQPKSIGKLLPWAGGAGGRAKPN